MKCPSCGSSRITKNDRGEMGCKNCPFVNKPMALIKLEEEKQKK